MGVSGQTLRTWVKRAEIDAGRAPGLTSEDREELRRLRRENRILREEREILKKAAAFFARESERPGSAFRFIAAEKAHHSIATMCRVLGVSRAGFYAWERRAPSDRDLADAWLLEKIREVHAESEGRMARGGSTPICGSLMVSRSTASAWSA